MRPLRALLVGLLLVSGCATSGLGAGGYATGAKENYDKGLADLKSENWLDAIKYFQYTRTKFGFSKWATLAELGLADANFGREKYQEAIDGYRDFIKSHPTHERTQDGYAAFRIGESFHKEIPTEWFLVPPAYEKDQGPVKDALREMQAFVDEYADSTYVPRARKLVADCQKRLADHELYVANFYLNRNQPMAAVGRLEGLVKQYPGSSFEPEVMLLLGQTYLKMEKAAEARRTFEQLIARHPSDYRARKAQLYLDFIARRFAGPGHG